MLLLDGMIQGAKEVLVVIATVMKRALPAVLAVECALLAWKYSEQVQTGSLLGNVVICVSCVAGACTGGYFGAFGGASAALAIYPCFATVVVGALMGAVLGTFIGSRAAAMITEEIVFLMTQLFRF
ncbi:hypothetical protein GCK32_021701 [Trichostrongylus colubriformis]|uniref:Uncharacterized protein n=1 Tax=Trichostrongylus colubriformis TaxID=6319 RepID=A0AAN8IXC3_TRICO